MITPVGSREPSAPPVRAEADAETRRLHQRIRVELTRLLREATPSGWVVVDGARHGGGDDAVGLGIVVRPVPTTGSVGPPLLCLDVHAGGDPVPGAPQRARRRSCAELGIDHYWSLDTVTRTLDVYVRAEEEYRHAETLTGGDWLDYGIGLVHLDVPRLLEG